ncbi:MAG: lysine--tRNA ligase, partial [Dysgonamonadaceae bacterium]|nr:lysine--tRNA ligase [Dysgonamonadaceae bacterium]
MSEYERTEQETFRRRSLEDIRTLNINPYPAEEFPINAKAKEITETFRDSDPEREVVIAGRIMSRRIMGKASFVELQDSSGRIQIYVTRDDICPGENKEPYNTVFRKLLDIGDLIGVSGYVFRTQTGTVSVHAKNLTLLAKSLRPLPIVKYKDNVAYDSFDDPELRYRQRYVDLIVNEGVKEIFVKRTKIFGSIRNLFNKHGYLEVDTPVLQTIPGGASARPFVTHHNALDIPLYLRIANELYLKRLIVGGFDGVYEFSRNFRNEGMDRMHNPEFTCLEIYIAYKDYNWMMRFTEQMLEHVCLEVLGTTEIKSREENAISFKAPFRRITMFDAIRENTGIDVNGMGPDELRNVCRKLHIEYDNTMGKGKLIDIIFGEKCENKYIQPTFIIDYPKEMSPLCKQHRENPELTERF